MLLMLNPMSQVGKLEIQNLLDGKEDSALHVWYQIHFHNLNSKYEPLKKKVCLNTCFTSLEGGKAH